MAATIVFDHLFHRLALYRDTLQTYAATEHSLSSDTTRSTLREDIFCKEINNWAQALLQDAWLVCHDSSSRASCPILSNQVDSPTDDLPPSDELVRILDSILLLHVTTTKQYSAWTRSFLSTFGTLDEKAIVSILKNPESAIEAQTNEAREDHALRGKPLRMAGMGLGAVAGGVLIGITGGLAAPLVGAGVTTVLGWLGVGGTAAGLLASGLAGSSVVCGALFGAYGARSTASMVERHTREISDLAIVPVREMKQDETLAVRLCVSGWLASKDDVTAPWTIFGGDDTFALQWEVQALHELSNALATLLMSHAMKYMKAEIIRRTILASLMSALSPVAWLKIGQIIDNPWMNSKALAIKAGAILGDLLLNRVFGNRPITMVGYSLGSLVIVEALKYLATFSPSETVHLVQDVFLFGTPTSTNPELWSSIRRVVSGRLVNGYSTNDYVLAVLSRASDASWGVAGLQTIDVAGVESMSCDCVDGHTQWRSMIGKCLQECSAPGIIDEEVKVQLKEAVFTGIEKITQLSGSEEDELVKNGAP